LKKIDYAEGRMSILVRIPTPLRKLTGGARAKRDIELAFYPDATILIISLLDQKNRSICAFQVKDGKVEERGIKISF
jgi:hypothetical protein